MILKESHGGVRGDHYAGKATNHKIMCEGLLWPNLHKDAKEYYHTCNVYQRVGNPSRRYEITLIPQVTVQLFDKRTVDFVKQLIHEQRDRELDT